MWLFYEPRVFCDEAHLKAIEATMKPRALAVPGATRSLDGSLEIIRLYIAKAHSDGPGLAKFIQQ